MRFALLCALSLALAGCGGPRKPAATTTVTSGTDASWFRDLVDAQRDLTLSIRPRVLSRDPVYGPLVRKAIRLTAASKRVNIGATALDAIQEADEILIAVRSSEPLDAVVVVSGVPSGIDVEKVVDDSGKSPWGASSRTPNGLTEILVRESDPPTLLYPVGERTWVFGAGKAARRVRDRLGLRSTRPGPVSVTDDAPVTIHVRGELLERLRGIARSGLRPVVDHLTEITLSLSQGNKGTVLCALIYEDERAAATAEGRTSEILAILPEKVSPRLEFLKHAEIKRQGRTVAVTATLPPDLLARLADVTETQRDATH
jgi:hypothetical protein